MKNNKFTLECIKKRLKSAPTKEEWIEIYSMDDLFKLSRKLSEKDTKKMLRELSNSIEIHKELYKAIGASDETKLECWKWIND